MRYSSVLLLVLIALCFITPCVVAQELIGELDERNAIPEDDPLLKTVPDPTLPEHRAPLFCGACGAVTMEAVDLLAPVIEYHRAEAARRRERGVKDNEVLREYETVDAYEKLCSEVSKKYGLFVSGAFQVTFQFTKHKPETFVRGGWMLPFLSRACEDLMDAKEEELTKVIFTAAKSHSGNLADEVKRIVCTEWEASKDGCDENGMPIDKRPKPSYGDL